MEQKNIAIAKLRNIRISPRKARLVIDMIRGKNVADAMAVLSSTRRRANPLVLGLLKSAVANAEQKDGSVAPDELVITEARVDGARTLKRMRARAMGRGSAILKRSSHILIGVGK